MKGYINGDIMIDYNELKRVIQNLPNNETILLSGHKNTDYDSMGSCLALTLFLAIKDSPALTIVSVLL